MNIEDLVKILKIPSATFTLTVKKEDRDGVVSKIQELLKYRVAEVRRETNGTKLILANKTIVIFRDKESLSADKIRQFEEVRIKGEKE